MLDRDLDKDSPGVTRKGVSPDKSNPLVIRPMPVSRGREGEYDGSIAEEDEISMDDY